MLTFSLAEEKLSVDSKSQATLQPPQESGLKITNWQGTFHPALDGHELPIDDYEFSRCLAVAADKTSFVLGTGGTSENLLRRQTAVANPHA